MKAEALFKTQGLSAKDEICNLCLLYTSMFKGTNIHYAMKGTNIMLMKGINNEISLQQIHKITGIVKDENGEPIIGANVSVKNQKTIGAITDMNGRFTIDVPVNVVLQVTYIGYIPQEINIGNKKNVNIFLKEDNKTLDEVVVVGYGVQKKVNVIGAVETVKADQIADKPVTSIVSALTGEAAGVTTVSYTHLLHLTLHSEYPN